MCIAIPGLIVAIDTGALPMARIDINGRLQDCCVAYVPEAEVGDYVLVQNGFAIEAMDAGAAAQSLAAFEELGVDVSSR